MLTILRHSTVALVAAGLLGSVTPAAAAVLYDNGALNGSIGSFTIGGYGGTPVVSDSFTLSALSTITGVDFGVWAYPGDVVSTVDWSIGTTPFGGLIASGMATVVSGVTHLNSLDWPIGVDSFSTGAVSLGPGTYYLALQNAVATSGGAPDGDPVYWDETDGLSSAFNNAVGSLINHVTGASGSESFQIIGPSADEVPEPASWVLMLVGFAGLGATLRGARILRRAGTAPAPHPPSAILRR